MTDDRHDPDRALKLMREAHRHGRPLDLAEQIEFANRRVDPRPVDWTPEPPAVPVKRSRGRPPKPAVPEWLRDWSERRRYVYSRAWIARGGQIGANTLRQRGAETREKIGAIASELLKAGKPRHRLAALTARKMAETAAKGQRYARIDHVRATLKRLRII